MPVPIFRGTRQQQRMSWMFLLLIAAVESNATPAKTEEYTAVAAARQQTPINAALLGLFSPPFVVLVGMSALFYTFEKFTKDMMKAASEKTRSRFRRKKKKPVEGTQAPAAAPVRQFVREHRKLIEALQKMNF